MSVMDNYDEDKFKAYMQNQYAPKLTLGDLPMNQKTDEIGQIVPRGTESPTPEVKTTSEIPAKESATQDIENEAKTVDAHPGHSEEELAPFIDMQKANIGKYGPEQEQAVMDSIRKQQGSFGNRAARGAASFADALMQGVARAGNPNFLGNLDTRQSRQEEQALSEIPKLGDMGNKQFEQAKDVYGTEKSLEMQKIKEDPNSSYSKTLRDAASKALGKPIPSNIPAFQIENVFPQFVELYKADFDKEFKMLQLQIQGQASQAEIENKKQGRDLEAEKLKSQNLSDLSKMSFINRTLHPGIANALKEGAGLSKPAVHPQTDEAIQWAKQNPNDPRSAKILERVGGQ